MKENTCKTCQNPDGSPNTDLLSDEGSCVFGCNRHVDTDTGFCPECKDHSTNVYECEDCGKVWEQEYNPNGKWSVQ